MSECTTSVPDLRRAKRLLEYAMDFAPRSIEFKGLLTSDEVDYLNRVCDITVDTNSVEKALTYNIRYVLWEEQNNEN